MTHRFAWLKPLVVTTLLLSGALLGSTAITQAADDHPAAPPGPHFGAFMQGSVADVPLAALDAGLKLSADQKSQISKLQQDYTRQREGLFPRPGSGGPPDPDTMRSNFQKMQTLNQETAQKIEATLTADQKQALPGLLKDLDTFRSTGIPAEMYGDLKLNADQKKRLSDLAATADKELQDAMQKARDSGDFGSIRDTLQQNRQQTHEKALKILTDDQQAAVEKYRKDHPDQGRFGFRRPPGGPPPGTTQL